jgi:beta-1,2-mannobiose phosphorylase / 1,2-beta-oligomannan phosphorylase
MSNITVTRSPHNPLLSPRSELLWESTATFNPSVLVENSQYHLAYRALSAQQNYENQIINLSTIGITTSNDGKEFNSTPHKQLIVPSEDFDHFGCEDPRLTKIDDEYLICYTGLSAWPPNAESIKVALAISDDLKTIKEKHLVTPFNAKAMALFPEKINGQYVAVLTVNTDQPPAHVAIAKFDRKEQLWDPSFWREWYLHLEDHILLLPRFNTDHVEVGAVPVKTDKGWVLIYSHIQNYFQPEKRIFGIEAALLDLSDPQKIIGRTNEPLLEPAAKYELEGMIKNVIFPSGAAIVGDDFKIYYGAADTVGAEASVRLDVFLSLLKNSDDKGILKFNKFGNNPILIPQEDQSWQAQAVFNSAALYEGNQFYLLFRAMSWDNTSTIGCAVSDDGFNFTQLTNDPVYVPRMEFENKCRPNAFSGCEDPRLTKFGDKIYMFYTAYDGQRPPRVALTSIKESDFMDHNWIWQKPILISSLITDNKNACLFPEKINNKFVVLHRTAGHEIAIDFINDLSELNEDKLLLEKEAAISPRNDSWDSAKIGIAGPPIKTEKGWLLIYHGVSKFDKNYRLGYMILDLEDPFHVLYRSTYPILEPQFEFEKKGIVDNVVFSCGAVEKDGLVYLYYGGADKVMCVATMEIKKLLDVV